MTKPGEDERLAILIDRDGLSAAVDFAKRTLQIYRTAVLTSRKRGHKKPHHASLPEYRGKFIKTYLYYKQFIKNNEVIV